MALLSPALTSALRPSLLPSQYEKIIEEYLAENKRQREAIKAKKGNNAASLHHYTAEEFGIDPKELVEGEYATYIKRYNVPMSSN